VSPCERFGKLQCDVWRYFDWVNQNRKSTSFELGANCAPLLYSPQSLQGIKNHSEMAQIAQRSGGQNITQLRRKKRRTQDKKRGRRPDSALPGEFAIGLADVVSRSSLLCRSPASKMLDFYSPITMADDLRIIRHQCIHVISIPIRNKRQLLHDHCFRRLMQHDTL